MQTSRADENGSSDCGMDQRLHGITAVSFSPEASVTAGGCCEPTSNSKHAVGQDVRCLAASSTVEPRPGIPSTGIANLLQGWLVPPVLRFGAFASWCVRTKYELRSTVRHYITFSAAPARSSTIQHMCPPRLATEARSSCAQLSEQAVFLHARAPATSMKARPCASLGMRSRQGVGPGPEALATASRRHTTTTS